jgi:hypothetical protein
MDQRADIGSGVESSRADLVVEAHLNDSPKSDEAGIGLLLVLECAADGMVCCCVLGR